MHHSLEAHLAAVGPFLGAFYLALALMNGVAAYYLWHHKHDNRWALVWIVLAALYTGYFAPMAFSMAFSAKPEWMPGMPTVVKAAVNGILGSSLGAVFYTVGAIFGFLLLFVLRRFLVKPMVGWALLNLSLLFYALSMTDQNFYAIAAKPDNVPIVGLMFLLGFFTWIATARAVENDDRIARGEPPKEKEDDEKVLVWPDLVYTELICMVLITALLLFWGIGLIAPLEEPASSVKTPNPSKAPWYFLGLQEMLVYFDPWMAGVVLPSLIVVGLMAIPYLDFNPKGNGYYTIAERQFSYLTFQFGFLVLWVTLIILGTFLRGPNWSIFAFYEFWDPHKVEALNNVQLSEIWWEGLLGEARPKAPLGSGGGTEFLYIIYREWLGIALVLGYFILLPPMMAVTVFRKFFVKMGFIRFMFMSNLMLFMMLLPIKMVLRWSFNLKYIIEIPEYFLNL
jgi:hypothetical protein